MTENRFADCIDVSGVLRQYRAWIADATWVAALRDQRIGGTDE